MADSWLLDRALANGRKGKQSRMRGRAGRFIYDAERWRAGGGGRARVV